MVGHREPRLLKGMIMDALEWTEDQAKEWRSIWDLPIMRAGLARLERLGRISGKKQTIAPGYDTRTVDAAALNFHKGQANILEEIQDMKERMTPKPLPKPFQPKPPPEQKPEEEK